MTLSRVTRYCDASRDRQPGPRALLTSQLSQTQEKNTKTYNIITYVDMKSDYNSAASERSNNPDLYLQCTCSTTLIMTRISIRTWNIRGAQKQSIFAQNLQYYHFLDMKSNNPAAIEATTNPYLHRTCSSTKLIKILFRKKAKLV